MKRRGTSRRVFFPWERRQGLFGAIGRARARIVAGAFAVLILVLWVHGREEKAAGLRATRASIMTMHRAVASYRADHTGSCPRELGELIAGGYARDVPVDAWGRPLRLTCPGRRDPHGFEISSDGPDGIAGGLDRVE